MNHSPAPFYIESYRLIKDANGQTVATVVYEDEAERERANAALLAAAPELLAACESALDKLNLTTFVNLYAEIEQAVNKAQGA